MSILEKAYLKALGQEQEAEKLATEEDLLGISASKPVASRKDTRDILFSRNGIAKMAQPTTYSTGELHSKGLVHSKMKDGKLLERYRRLRTKLLSQGNGKNFSTLVTSVAENDDAVIVAANLAATIALDEGKTAVLIEGNIHRPKLNQLFDCEDHVGLIDYLEAEDWDGKEAISATGIPRLRFVPSGRKRENSAEYFTSEKMQEFVNELQTRYSDRYTVVAAPGIMNSADTSILMQLCDRVVLVVPYGSCTEEEIIQAALAVGEEKLAGVVLDQF